MLDADAVAAARILATDVTRQLHAGLLNVQRALAGWDAHDADPERVAAPPVSRELLRERRTMLVRELLRAAGLPRPS